jgi:hypothetical protein
MAKCHWTLIAAGLAIFVTGCQPATATFNVTANSGASAFREKGAREAKDALAAGVLKLKEYPPLPSPAWQGKYIQLLKERCGVDYEVPQLPKGTSEADFIEEIRGWNGVMEAEIKRKFGDDILQKLREEAQAKK